MLLVYRREAFNIPQTSSCIIHTTGTIKDGDVVSISSPVFTSTNWKSRETTTSDQLDVVVRVINNEGFVINNDKIIARLRCGDNSPFGMCVECQ